MLSLNCDQWYRSQLSKIMWRRALQCDVGIDEGMKDLREGDCETPKSLSHVGWVGVTLQKVSPILGKCMAYMKWVDYKRTHAC